MSSQPQPPPSPPVAQKREHKWERFEDVRVDNYHWLRDDSRKKSEVIDYLRKENAYTEAIMSGTKKYEDDLYDEMRGRIKDDGSFVPQRTLHCGRLKRERYGEYCRCHDQNSDSPPSDYVTMVPGSDPHAMLRENAEDQYHDSDKPDISMESPNGELVAIAKYGTGNKKTTVRVVDKNEEVVEEPFTVALSIKQSLEWAGNKALLYTTENEAHRADKVWLHKLMSHQSVDSCLYHEEDDKFVVHLELSESEDFLFVACESKTTRNVFYLEVSKLENGLKVLTHRINGTETFVSHRGNHFFIMTTSDEFFNSILQACPVDDTSATTVLIPHRPSVIIENIKLFSDHLVVLEREQGLRKLTTYGLPAAEEPLSSLELQPGWETRLHVNPVYSLNPLKSVYSSTILGFSYSSLRMPTRIYKTDMKTGVLYRKMHEEVLGDFDASNYVTERKWATASDGTQIPISIVFRNDLVKRDGTDPLLLHGYGSYEKCIEPQFLVSRMSLLDRGLIFAIAHIRGGGEFGREWYRNGMLLKKKNTFRDFIACAEFLIENKYCSKDKLCIEGTSAGGLLIGAVVNMRPDLFKAAVARLPFLDVLTTMQDPTLPLTTLEWEEWGDPRKEEYYFYIKSYSPVDNVKAQNYPNILVTAGLHDKAVMYWEPAKFVAKLRAMKTDDNLLLFKCDLDADHFSKQGRFERLKEAAFVYTFILKSLKMIPDSGSAQN